METPEAVKAENAVAESPEQSTDQSQEETTPQLSVEELAEQLESIKRAQQGSDRKVSELEKERNRLKAELEETKKSSMTAEQQLEYDRKIQEEKAKDFETKLKMLEQDNLKKDYMLKNNINPAFAQYLSGESAEEMAESAKTLLEVTQLEAEKIVKQKLQKSTPAKGESDSGSKTMTRAAFENLDFTSRQSYIKQGYNIID